MVEEEGVEAELDEVKRRLVVRTGSGTREEFPWVWLRLHYSIHPYKRRSFTVCLKVHKIENFFDSDFGICVISLLGTVCQKIKILQKKFF